MSLLLPWAKAERSKSDEKMPNFFLKRRHIVLAHVQQKTQHPLLQVTQLVKHFQYFLGRFVQVVGKVFVVRVREHSAYDLP